MQRIYADVIVTTYKDNDKMHIWTVNDQHGFAGKVVLKFYTYDQKNSSPKKEITIHLGELDAASSKEIKVFDHKEIFDKSCPVNNCFVRL